MGGSVNTGRKGTGRSAWLGVGLVILVAACGIGGMLVGRQYLHRDTATRAARAIPESRSTSPAVVPSQSGTALPAGGVDSAPQVVVPVPTHRAASSAAPPSSALAVPSSAAETPGGITEDGEVGLALRRWRTALLTNDSAQIAPSYAVHVNRFFLKTQVSRTFVRDYMERDEEQGTRLTKYNLQDLAIRHVKPDEVEITFHADFAVSTPKTDRVGSARTTLMMRMEEGDWKIFYERDFKS